MSFAETYLAETIDIVGALDPEQIEDVVDCIADVRDAGGRMFVLGVGGSAATASHACNDLRKIAGIEAYAPTDNVAELTARVNDDGWEHTLAAWLDTSRISESDGVLVFSVGGGSSTVSANIVAALEVAIEVDAGVMGVVGRSGGHTAAVADACVVIPAQYENRVTGHTEGIALVVWHCICNHPRLAR